MLLDRFYLFLLLKSSGQMPWSAVDDDWLEVSVSSS
jgi:hypothetical protein